MKYLFLFAFSWMILSSVQAQNFSIGPRAGISQTKLSFEKGNFVPDDAEVGYHLGLFARIGGAGFFVQPEVLYSQTSGTFTLNGPVPGGNPDKFEAEFNRLDIPVMVGVKLFKFFRIQAGPIGSIDINSELRDAASTVESVDFKSATLGYQAGIGLDLGNLVLDAKYEGGLGSVIENVGSLQTDQRINQFVFSVGFKLF